MANGWLVGLAPRKSGISRRLQAGVSGGSRWIPGQRVANSGDLDGGCCCCCRESKRRRRRSRRSRRRRGGRRKGRRRRRRRRRRRKSRKSRRRRRRRRGRRRKGGGEGEEEEEKEEEKERKTVWMDEEIVRQPPQEIADYALQNTPCCGIAYGKSRNRQVVVSRRPPSRVRKQCYPQQPMVFFKKYLQSTIQTNAVSPETIRKCWQRMEGEKEKHP